jgi:membrane-bound hydrogenase subunit mbhJ
MFTTSARQKSISVYHLHMGGPDGDALEWRALKAPRYDARLKTLGVRFVESAWEADVIVLTGLLLATTLDHVLQELSNLPQPTVVVAAGDSAINGGQWAKLEMPGLAPYSLDHYVDIQISVPGDPPTPQALLAALAAAAERLVRPSERLAGWQDQDE